MMSGIGVDPDTAVLNAMKNAVQQETRVLVDTTTTVDNGKIIENTIITRSAAYINGYELLRLEKHGNTWTARVLCKVDEKKLRNDLKPVVVQQNSIGINGPLLGILALQQNQIEADIARNKLEQELLKEHELKNLKRFLEDSLYRSRFSVRVKSFHVSVQPTMGFTLNIETDLPPYGRNRNFFKVGETYGLMKAEFISKNNSVVHESLAETWFPWNSAHILANLSPGELAKINQIRIKWM